MTTAIERFRHLRVSGWKIEDIHIKYESTPTPVLRATATLSHGKQSEVIESENDEFTSHVSSYRHLPNLLTGEVELTFVEDTKKYHELEKKFIDFACGLQPYLSVRGPTTVVSQFDRKRISAAIETWIESERHLSRAPSRLPRLFYDVLVLSSSDGRFDCSILEKERLCVEEVHQMTAKASAADWAYAFSVVFLCPKLAKDIDMDAVMIVALYDLKKKESTACVGTVKSVFNHRGRRLTKGLELFEAATDLFRRSIDTASWHFIIVAPFRDSEFTPIPWIAYVLLQDLPIVPTDGVPLISVPEIVLFGDPGLPNQRSSLDFKAKAQTTALILEMRDAKGPCNCTVHFDRSLGEPDFHVDVEVKPIGSAPGRKLVSHMPVMLRDVWNFSQDLYLAFMTAGAFDVRFDTLVSADIRDFNQLMKEEPLAVYPLIYRGHIEPKVRWLRSNPNVLTLLKRIWQDDRYTPAEAERPLVAAAETQELLDSGALTSLAVWILNRGQV